MTYLAEVLADTPSAYWRMADANIAAGLADSSGNARHGTWNASTAVGVFGAASLLTVDTNASADFNASTNSYAQIAAAAWSIPAAGAGLSLEAIIRPDTIGTAQTIMSKDSGSGFSRWWDLTLNAAGNLVAYVYDNTGSPVVRTITSTATLAANTTYHVVATYDSSLRLYINGAAAATAVGGFTGARATGTNQGIRVGGRSFTANQPFDGRIDEVAVYIGTALSAARVLAHYTASVASGPNVPTNVGANVVNGDELFLHWDPPASGPTPTGYDTRVNGGAATDRGNTLAWSFTGLTPSTTYLLGVRAHDLTGSSAWVEVSATTASVVVPAGGYVATVTVGDHAWSVTSADPAGYGVLAGLRVGWTARQDDGWPTQHNPTQATFGIIVEEGEDLADVDIGAHVLIRFYVTPPTAPTLEFSGTVRDLTALPHPAGMVYRVTALDYLKDLQEVHTPGPAAAIEQNATDRLTYLTETVAGLPSVFNPPTVPYPESGLLPAFAYPASTAYDLLVNELGRLAAVQSWSGGKGARAIIVPNLDADGDLVAAKPWEAVWVLCEADPYTIVDAAQIPTEAVEYRRLRQEPNRAEETDGTFSERPHPGIPTITRIVPTDDTDIHTNLSWIVLYNEDLPNQWSTVWRLSTPPDPAIVEGWFTLPAAMTTFVSISNIATRHNPTGLDTYSGILSGASLVVSEDRRWWVDFTLRRSVPVGTVLPESVLWSEVDPLLTWTDVDPAITWSEADELGLTP
jgi:hypothetical protein